MTTILALETATTSCSVALYHDGAVTSRFEAKPREHTRLVLPMVDALLAESGLSLSRVDALAFTAGPGSFTGLRIGFGVVQGLAFGADIPVLPVSTLESLALAGCRRFGLAAGQVLPALDARMGEIYWGLYHFEGGILNVDVADRVSRPEQVSTAGFEPPALGVGDGWNFLADNLAAGRIDPDLTPDAACVAELAVPRFARGEALPVERVELAYIRNEVTWKKREKIRRL